MVFTGASADFSFQPFASPLPPGTDIVKCVMLQIEDTSEIGAHTFSDIDLSVKIRSQPVGTFCSGQESLISTTTDDSHDVKSMVAVESSTLPGKCVEVVIDKIAVPQGAITTRTFCYAASEVDDEPQ